MDNQVAGDKLNIVVINAWRGIVDGEPVSFYAGSYGGRPTDGVVCLRSPHIPPLEGIFCIPSPTQHGGLRVVAEQDNRLTLVSTDGTIYYFDLPALLFVPSLEGTYPTATLPPPTEPYPGPLETATAVP
jgi:hypothetical protein